MACWTASAKWAAGPALDGQRDMPLALSLTEWLGLTMEVGVFVHVGKSSNYEPRGERGIALQRLSSESNCQDWTKLLLLSILSVYLHPLFQVYWISRWFEEPRSSDLFAAVDWLNDVASKGTPTARSSRSRNMFGFGAAQPPSCSAKSAENAKNRGLVARICSESRRTVVRSFVRPNV